MIHLSDLHAQSFGRGNARLLTMIREEAPDGIVITGDLVGRFSRRTDPMFSLLEKLCRIAPVYYVSGNHEYGRRDREEIFARAAQAGRSNPNERYWQKTLPLRLKLFTKVLKSPFLYRSFLRKLVMKSGIQSIKITETLANPPFFAKK